MQGVTTSVAESPHMKPLNRHTFDVAGVVAVLSVNRAALEHAVGGPHGSKDAAERYMRRFVDQATRLTDPRNDTTTKFLEYLYEETGISSRMNPSDYTRPMFEALARPEHSSPRDLEQSVHRAAFVLSSIPPSSHDRSHSMWAWELTAMTLMILREVNWDAYRRFVSGYGDAFDAGQGLRTVPPNGSPLNVEGDVRFRMELMFLLSSRNGRPPILDDAFWNRYIGQGREADMKELRELYDSSIGQIRGREPDIEYLAGLIEMTGHAPTATQAV